MEIGHERFLVLKWVFLLTELDIVEDQYYVDFSVTDMVNALKNSL